jgi:hypothetical protein
MLKHTPALCTHVTISDDRDESGGLVKTIVPLAMENTGDSAFTVVSCSEVIRMEKAALVAVDGDTSHENRPCDAGTPEAIVATGTPLRRRSSRTVPLTTAAFAASHVTERGLLFTLMLPARGAPTTRPKVGPLAAVTLTLATRAPSWLHRTTTVYATPFCSTPVPLARAPGQLTLPRLPGRPVPITPTTAPVEALNTVTVTVPAASVLPKPRHEMNAGAKRYSTAFGPGADKTIPAAGGETTVISGEEENREEELVDAMRKE